MHMGRREGEGLLIGFYDHTVVLTLLSLMSAVCGCIVSCSGSGHPYLGGFFLLFCGLFDAFDGRVARARKNRTRREMSFGAHLDSLSDLVAFGVLPCSIAVGLLTSDGIQLLPLVDSSPREFFDTIGFVLILLFYCVAALIRLAFFNVLDEERRHRDDSGGAYFIGMPVTMAALIFPLILTMNYFIPRDFSVLYTLMMVIVGILFLVNVRIKKPSNKLVYALVCVGAIEFVLMLLILLGK